jgi:hypothetical protein
MPRTSFGASCHSAAGATCAGWRGAAAGGAAGKRSVDCETLKAQVNKHQVAVMGPCSAEVKGTAAVPVQRGPNVGADYSNVCACHKSSDRAPGIGKPVGGKLSGD